MVTDSIIILMIVVILFGLILNCKDGNEREEC